MKFKFIPRQRSNNSFGDYGTTLQFLLRGALKQGSLIQEFEKEFAQKFGADHALAISSCRSAFYLIVKGLGIKEGDEVILPAFNMSIFPKVLKLYGINPVFVDIDERTLNIDVTKIEEKITPKTKAIVAVHLFGNVCKMDVLMAIADKHKIDVIEDCANTVNAHYQGKLVGSFGRAACFSLGHSKDVATFCGGMVLTNNDALYLKMKELHDQEFEFSTTAQVLKMLAKNFILKIVTCRMLFPVLLYPFIFLAEKFNNDILNDALEEKGIK